jgi:hypothetical protein
MVASGVSEVGAKTKGSRVREPEGLRLGTRVPKAPRTLVTRL